MFLIGKLQTIDGCRLRLPCPAGRLLGVARLTAEFDATTRGWESLIAGHPALLVFCIDRYEQQSKRPPSDLKALAKWARQELASQLLVSNTIKPCGAAGESKQSDARSLMKRWRRADSLCDRNRVLFQWMKQRLPPKTASRPIKKWLKQSAKAVLGDTKFDSPKKSPKKRRLVRRSSRYSQQDSVSLPTLKAFLRVASENSQLQEAFHEQLQTEKLAALKQLAYGASHEINNPLANIATGAQALIQSESNPDRRRRLANIYGQSMAAHDMISDLMLFAHPPSPVKETVELRTLIREIAQRSDQRGQSIKVTFGPHVASANFDRNQIAIMIEALLRNSFEAIAQQEDASSDDVATMLVARKLLFESTKRRIG